MGIFNLIFHICNFDRHRTVFKHIEGHYRFYRIGQFIESVRFVRFEQFFIESGSFYWTEPTWLKFSEMSRFSDQNDERWERILSVSSGKFWNQNWSPRVVHLCWENLKINSRSWTRVSKLRETDHKNIERVPPYFLILLKAFLVL